MEMLELHILQSFPVTCLNRDDVGAPKSAVFGGVTRGRVSSQCWKRAIRSRMQELCKELSTGKRSRKIFQKSIAPLIKEKLEEKRSESDVESFIDKCEDIFNKAFIGKDSALLLYLSSSEMDKIASALVKAFLQEEKLNENKLKDVLKRVTKELVPTDGVDIAIFGRMVANAPDVTLEGAGLFSHALSTHRVDNDIDYFSALDDLQEEEETGAGHLGLTEYNSATYYRYIGLNLDLLFSDSHAGSLNDEEKRKVLEAFLRACIEAVPHARKNSMFGFTLPFFVLGLYRDKGQPISLVNAFEKPVFLTDETVGYAHQSAKRLISHFNEMRAVYTDKLYPFENGIYLTLEEDFEVEPDGGNENRVERADNIDNFMETLLSKVRIK